ncbi:MAG TPA: TldD protein, partial [Stenotrophomonas sp.]|nr:TldD protein [Stenotrophomonas sp.]
TAPVQLAAAPGVGEVSWKTPIRKNAMDVPIKEKVDLLLDVNAAAMAAGASFVNSMLFLVNEQ